MKASLRPKISIVVPCYNADRFLAETLASVTRQSIVEWEGIVVDDGSSDTSGAIARKFADDDDRIRVFHQSNHGRALALRAGCEHIDPHSRYLFFLDADDLLHPNALSVLSDYLDRRPDVAIVTCDAQLIDATGGHLQGVARSRWTKGCVLPRQMRESENVTPFMTFFCATGQGPFAMHRKSVFVQTDGFDGRFSPFSLHEDSDIFCQMSLLGSVHYLPEKLYFTRRHGNNVSVGSNPKIHAAYGQFRNKWDSYEPRNAGQEVLLFQASQFYHGLFMPCRNIKVAMIAFREAVTARSLHPLRFGLTLVAQALVNWIRYSLLGGNPRRKRGSTVISATR